jgi:hypothetical protein
MRFVGYWDSPPYSDHQNWDESLSFEKVVKYLPHFKSAIQVPIYAIGIDL